jgi:hypothetical protein
MPKLNAQLATAAGAAVTSSFEPLPEGVYQVALKGVDIKEGQKGPYWVWEFEIPAGSDHAGRRFWLNTSLSEAALWKLNETFAAFGATTDTDTDELIGKVVKAVVVQRTIQAGARAGEVTNQIDQVLPSATGASPAAAAAAAAPTKSFDF